MIVICYFLPFLCIVEEDYEGCIVKTGNRPQLEVNLICNKTKTRTIPLSPEIVKWIKGNKYEQCLAETRNQQRIEVDFACEQFRPKLICVLNSDFRANIGIGSPCNQYKSYDNLETTTIEVEKTLEEKRKIYQQCKSRRKLKKFMSLGLGQMYFSSDPCKKHLD
ncbi:unnamed protein product [Caenorhabditis angaria]|uniref:DUF19 domain-containing protein n=1 Tax=Caenorhabditis angaria TaxID=860376 RepID=A0A9P1ICL6_9PELO|nr:unnamed protein product [Caenorhabditis angaria]